MIFTAFLLLLVILVIIDRWKDTKLQKAHSVLGHDALYLPLLGQVHIFFGSNEARLSTLMKIAKYSYTRKHGAASVWLLNNLLVVVSDPEQAAAVLKSTNCKGHLGKLARELIGNGTIFAPVRIWYSRRKILLPCFTTKYLSRFVNVFEEQSKIIVKNLQPHVGKGNVPIFNYLSAYALDSICETAFGININIQEQKNFPFVHAFEEYFKNVAIRTFQPWLLRDILYRFLPIYKTQMKHKKVIYEFIDNLIHKKKALICGETQSSHHKAQPSRTKLKTFVDEMIESSTVNGKEYTNKDLRDEVLMLALAGTDTSAAGTSYVLLMLSQYPDIQEKVYQEILDVIGDSDRPLEMGDLQKLEYMDAVIKETMRLYPPIPAVARYCPYDVQLPSGVILPAKATVSINILGIHRNPNYWGDDADEFIPDRFMSRPLPVACAYMPFATGPRNCIGYQYATLSMKAVITTLLRNFCFMPASSFTYGKDNPLRLSFDITMKHLDNYHIQIEPRNKCYRTDKKVV